MKANIILSNDIRLEKISSHFFLFLCSKISGDFLDNASIAFFLLKLLKKEKEKEKKYSMIIQSLYSILLIIDKLTRSNNLISQQKNAISVIQNSSFSEICFSFWVGHKFYDNFVPSPKDGIKKKSISHESFCCFEQNANFIYFNKVIKLFYQFFYQKKTIKKEFSLFNLYHFNERTETLSSVNSTKNDKNDFHWLKNVLKIRTAKLRNKYQEQKHLRTVDSLSAFFDILKKIPTELYSDSIYLQKNVKFNKIFDVKLTQIEKMTIAKPFFLKSMFISRNFCVKKTEKSLIDVKIKKNDIFFSNYCFILIDVIRTFFLICFFKNSPEKKGQQTFAETILKNDTNFSEKKSIRDEGFLNKINNVVGHIFMKSIEKDFLNLRILFLFLKEKSEKFAKTNQAVETAKKNLNFVATTSDLKNFYTKMKIYVIKGQNLLYTCSVTMKKILLRLHLAEKIINQQFLLLRQYKKVMHGIREQKMLYDSQSKSEKLTLLENKIKKLKKHLTNKCYHENNQLIEILRKKVNCPIKKFLPKDVVLIQCGHLFSSLTIKDLINTRNRKCPMCRKNFSIQDIRCVFFS